MLKETLLVSFVLWAVSLAQEAQPNPNVLTGIQFSSGFPQPNPYIQNSGVAQQYPYTQNGAQNSGVAQQYPYIQTGAQNSYLTGSQNYGVPQWSWGGRRPGQGGYWARNPNGGWSWVDPSNPTPWWGWNNNWNYWNRYNNGNVQASGK